MGEIIGYKMLIKESLFSFGLRNFMNLVFTGIPLVPVEAGDPTKVDHAIALISSSCILRIYTFGFNPKVVRWTICREPRLSNGPTIIGGLQNTDADFGVDS